MPAVLPEVVQGCLHGEDAKRVAEVELRIMWDLVGSPQDIFVVHAGPRRLLVRFALKTMQLF